MKQDYYPEPDEAPEQEPAEGQEQESKKGGSTALIPKSLLGGKTPEVGEEITLKVTHIYEDEVAVETSSESEEEEKEELPGDEEFDEQETTTEQPEPTMA